ncbi:hypothetical protein [Ponticaulis koreensis]|uniref:hypothetical protein n=1 Tax=Ponticaulis koreensis TaxID=1123045 RepID=UPI0012DC7525|nr:hypothetical protein [Ponticaulis koreensis]
MFRVEFAILRQTTTILLGFAVCCAMANAESCDFVGSYENTCVEALAGERNGGVLLIWMPNQGASCGQLVDTANFTAHQYCTSEMVNGTRANHSAAAGAVPLTCEGTIQGSYIEDRDAALTQLLNDGTGNLASSGFPTPATNSTLAYSKFLCD